MASALLSFVAVAGWAQKAAFDGPSVLSRFASPGDAESLRLPPVDGSVGHLSLPLIAPEFALQTFEDRGRRQTLELPSYTDDTLVMAELPETSQRGAFQLQRSFLAPHSLNYKPVNFTGDSFVKTSVIGRILQSEVDYVSRGDNSQTALTPANYKFVYKGLQEINGHLAHVYQVKPRKKRAGLFKGHMYLDAHTGALVRSEGTIARSPSFFVRNIEFVQDYGELAGYTVPSHLHSKAQARIVGRTVVDVYHRDYQLQPATAALSGAPSAPGQR